MQRDRSIVVLTPGGSRLDSDEAKTILAQLGGLISIEEVDRIALDLSRVESPEKVFVYWMLGLDDRLSRRYGPGRLVAFNPTPAMRDILSVTRLARDLMVTDSLEDAIARLRSIGPKPTDPFDADRWSRVPPRELGSLCLIGCPERDLAQVPGQLRANGFDLVEADAVGDGDHVLFCISCADGPTDSTRRSVDRCAGRLIMPIAIVLTRNELLYDDSLRELVTFEEMELLSRIMPSQEVERIPLLYDFDPNLPGKVKSKMVDGSGLIRCRVG
jgi:hypothetical protein